MFEYAEFEPDIHKPWTRTIKGWFSRLIVILVEAIVLYRTGGRT